MSLLLWIFQLLNFTRRCTYSFTVSICSSFHVNLSSCGSLPPLVNTTTLGMKGGTSMSLILLIGFAYGHTTVVWFLTVMSVVISMVLPMLRLLHRRQNLVRSFQKTSLSSVVELLLQGLYRRSGWLFPDSIHMNSLSGFLSVLISVPENKPRSILILCTDIRMRGEGLAYVGYGWGVV